MFSLRRKTPAGKKLNGQTLVELLVVLVIILILASIIFAVGSRAYRAVMSLTGK